MSYTHRSGLAAFAVAALLLGGFASADAALTTPACLAKKLNEWGKLRKCQATENGKALQGKTADPAKCQTKFDTKLATLSAQATAAAIACRYGVNTGTQAGTVTDYDTGLQWEQKTDDCPAGYSASGTYTTTFPSSGPFTVTVDASGTTYTSGTNDSVAGPGSCSGSVTGTTFTGTCSFGLSQSGSFDCLDQTIAISFSGFISGSGSGTATGTDLHDAFKRYTWSSTSAAPDGTAFTSFLGTLNNGTSPGPDAIPISGCFAGHCDWRLPSIVELLTIVDPSASGCGDGPPCIDPAFGPTEAGHGVDYWSATTFAINPVAAWTVPFVSGGVSTTAKNFDVYVRGVRSAL
jgi:Protein of unknown function (DUF1566)